MLAVSKKFMVEVQLLHHFHSSKSIHHTSNKKFSDFGQLSKQHHQIEICEASHFLHHFGIGSLQTIFLVETNRYLCH